MFWMAPDAILHAVEIITLLLTPSGLVARGMPRDLSFLYCQRPGRAGSRALSASAPQSATQAGSGLSQEPGIAPPPDLPDWSDQQADLGALSAGLGASGLGGVEALGYQGRPNRLHPHAASLEQHFRQTPPSTCAQAQQVIATQTGVRRGLTQVRAFRRRLKMKYRKTGLVPGQAETPEKQAEQAAFLKKPSAQAGRSASGPAGGAVLRGRAFCGRRLPRLLVVLRTGVLALALGTTALQRVGGAGCGQSASASLHP